MFLKECFRPVNTHVTYQLTAPYSAVRSFIALCQKFHSIISGAQRPAEKLSVTFNHWH